MKDGWVKSISEGRDFEVLILEDLKFSKQRLMATKITPSLRNLLYEEIEKVGYVFLRSRRLRGGMIKVFNMNRGIDKVNLGKIFCIDEDRRKI